MQNQNKVVHLSQQKQTTMTTLKITTNATEAVKTLFTSIFGYAPNEIKNNGSFYWADQIGFSHFGKFIIKNELYNGK